MAINLAIQFAMPTGSVSNFVQYARVDNVATPIFTTVVPNPVSSPAVIATNVPDGQYQIQSTPVYPDGRICSPTIQTTPACPGLISISASIQGGVMTGVLVITYLAPASVPSVLITVNYPNGGSFSQIYVNNGNPISIGLPANVFGNYSVFGQSVCDVLSGFYSPPSTSVIVNYQQAISGSYYLSGTANGTCSAAITTLYTNGSPVPGSILYTDAGLTNAITGYLFVLYAGVIYNLNSTTGVLGSDTGIVCNANTVSIGNAFFAGELITGVTGIAGFFAAPAFPLSAGNTSRGPHTSFTGTISISYSGITSASRMFLIHNGVTQQCVGGLIGSGTAVFASSSYLASDTISIQLDGLAC